MADTYTQSLKARKIEQGGYSNSYADRFNADMVDVFDAGISGVLDIDIGSSTTYALEAMQNGTLSETHYWRLNFTGTPASSVTITVPASVTPSKHYLIDNQTGQALTIKYAATSGVTVQDNDVAHVYCDGTTVTEDWRPTRYKITAAEIAAGVTPTDYGYAPGDVRRYGAVGDGTTDDSAAIQVAFDLVLAQGGKVIFEGAKTYKCNSGLTLVSTTNPAKDFRIEYNNCLLDFSDLTGGAVALTYGADSLANSHDQESVTIGDVRLLGPETLGAGVPTYATRVTTTTGVYLNFCLHWTIGSHTIQAFYKGMRTRWSWSTLHLNHHIRTCYIGLHVDDISTYATWVGCNFIECGVGTLFRPATDSAICQTFLSCRWEGNSVHGHFDSDPGAAGATYPVRDIAIISPYLEAAVYDWFRVGMDYDETASQATRQATNASGYVLNLKFSGGEWANNALDPATGTAAFCFDSADGLNARVKAMIFDGPISLSERCRGRPSKSSWHTTVNQNHDSDDLESFDCGEFSANLTMTSSAVTLGRSKGNIASVAFVADGVFDVTFREAYAATAEYTVHGCADDRIVTVSKTSATVCRVTTRDYAGTAAFAGTVQLFGEGRMA